MKTDSKTERGPSARPTRKPFFGRRSEDAFFTPAPLRPTFQPGLAGPPPIQRRQLQRPAATGEASVPPQVESEIESERGRGVPLSGSIRGPMEQALGADLSDVKLHTDPRSDRLSRSLEARAFTTGRDVFFRQSEYSPDSRDGRGLLAHELTHVVQQTGGGAAPRSSDGTGHAQSTAQRKPLVDTMVGTLAPEAETAGEGLIQCALVDDLPGLLKAKAKKQDRYDSVVKAIRKASVAERQVAVVSKKVLRLLRKRLSKTHASAAVSELLVGSQSWDNPPATDFYKHFVLKKGKGSIPLTKTMNCWESIMYAAHLSGQLSAKWIRNYYVSAGALPKTKKDPTKKLWSQLGFSTSLPEYTAAGKTLPTVGQLIFYLRPGKSIPSHVAVYVGNKEVISLWTEPNNISTVQRIAITAISGKILFANPPW